MMRRALFIACTLTVALGLTSTQLSSPAPAEARPVRIGRHVNIPYGISERHSWPTGGGGPQRTYRSGFTAPTSAPANVFTARVGIGRVFSPVVDADGTLHVGAAGGLTSLSPDGAVLASVRLGLVTATPSIDPEGRIVVGAQPGDLVTVRNGRVDWRAGIGAGLRGSPLVLVDGSVIVSGFDQAIHRFDSAGRRLFRTPVSTHVRGAPALTRDGRIIVPVGSSLLFLDPQGNSTASVPLGSEVVAGPAIADDGSIYVLTSAPSFVVVDDSGHVRSRTEIDSRIATSTTLAVGADGAIRFGTIQGGLRCVGPDGTERFRAEPNTTFVSGVVVDADGTALVTTQAGTLVAVDSHGALLWRVPLGARADAAPVIARDGTIYVATFNGTVQAWR